MKRLKIVFFAYFFPPSPVAGAARADRFYRFLPEFGIDVDVITGAPQAKPDPNIQYVPGLNDPNRSSLEGLAELVLRRFFAPNEMALVWSLRAAWGASGEYSAILSSGPPVNVSLAAQRLQSRTGLPWVADFRDPLAGNPTRMQLRIPRRVDRFLEARIVNRADLLVVNTDAIRDQWAQRYPKRADRIRLLWNGFDPDHPVEAGQLPADGPLQLVHAGTMYENRDHRQLLLSIRRLVDAGRLDPGRLRVRQVGPVWGPLLASFETEFQSLIESGCVAFHPPVEPAAAQQAIREAHYLLLPDVRGPSSGVQLPSKLFEYVQVGRPVLALTNRDSPVDRILARSGIRTVSLDPDDSDDVTDAKVLEFLGLPTEPQSPSAWFLDEFDGRRQAGRLAEMIRSVAER